MVKMDNKVYFDFLILWNNALFKTTVEARFVKLLLFFVLCIFVKTYFNDNIICQRMCPVCESDVLMCNLKCITIACAS